MHPLRRSFWKDRRDEQGFQGIYETYERQIGKSISRVVNETNRLVKRIGHVPLSAVMIQSERGYR